MVMSITRKDTIVLAVLFNIVVLACILATSRQLFQGTTTVKEVIKEVPQAVETPKEESKIAFDEIDQLLEEYISTNQVEKETSTKPKAKKPPAVTKAAAPLLKNPSSSDEEFYIVRGGDNPWTIAKKSHISFERLLELNHLNQDTAKNLKIGQKLRIKEPQ
jgi:hypothetical protein